jgi:CheY-like chemotaxis protein
MIAMTTPNSSPNSAPVRILVVDDHPNTAATFARAISQFGPGIDVISSDSGEKALEQVRDKSVDMLITDMVMPGMNGLELIERMQSHPGGRPSYTVLITAYDVPGVKESARRLKVNEFVIKPVKPERICQIVANALKDMGRSQAQVHQISTNTKVPPKILIADDLPDNVTLLSRFLQNEGYVCIAASNGLEALEKVHADSPDMLLLDVNMPGKDGFEVLQEIRADPAVEHLPVIILTAARIDSVDLQAGLNLGADDYVTKPFDRRELLARIRTKLRVKEAEDVIRRRNKELNVLPEIGKDLSARLDISELTDVVLRRTVETLGALHGHIIVFDPKGTFHKEYHIPTAAHVSDSALNIPSLVDMSDQLKETRQSVIIDDSHQDDRWKTTPDDPTHSVIIVPMFGRTDLIGMLVLTHEQSGYFKVDHKILLQAIASQAAIAVENAQLYESVSQEQERMSVVLHSAPHPIVMFDVDGTVILANPAAEKLFSGMKRGEQLERGHGYDDLLDFLDEASMAEASRRKEISWPDGRNYSVLRTPTEGGGCAVVFQDAKRFTL